VRVMAQLMDPSTGHPIWAERYDRDITDLFRAQEELAALIVSAVRKKLAAASPALVEGLAHLKQFTPDSLTFARDCFERAIRNDRDNPAIYVAMADYYAAAAVLAIREPKLLFPKAEWAAKRALELDPSESGAHAPLAVVQALYHCRWDLAAVHLRRVLENESHFAPFLFVLAAGLKEMPTSTSPGALAYRAVAQYLVGDSTAAHRSAGLILETEPLFWPASLLRSLIDSDTQPPLGIVWSHGVLARRGPEQAQSVYDTLAAQKPSRYVPSTLFATAFLTRGELENAFAALDRAANERDPLLPTVLMDPALEPLRGDPKIVALFARVGLAAGRESARA
jgi:hypothetical protein